MRPVRLFAIALAALLPLSVSPSHAASFDCAAAQRPDERAICGSRLLNDRDVEMALRYDMMGSLVPMGARDLLHRDQVAWLSQRRACDTDHACLLRLYDERILRLKDMFQERVASQGPF